MANRALNSGPFSGYAKTLELLDENGTCIESGTAIDSKREFVVNGNENQEFHLVTNADQWTNSPAQSNIDLTFDGIPLKITKVELDAASAAYMISATTYKRVYVTFESNATVSDGQGGYTDGWTTFATTSAEIIYLDASEAMQAGRVETGQLVKLYFRYSTTLATLTEKMRATISGESMPIRSVNILHGYGDYIEVICERIKAS